MKNIVFIIVDSLKQESLSKQEYSNLYLMPFIQSLSDKTISFTNLYSQGPYTEAGTKSLLCGTNVMDDYGYLLRFDRGRAFLSNIFKQLGYKTISLQYPTSLMSDWIINNTDEMIHTSDFMFDVLWEQKFKYYQPFFLKNKETPSDVTDCIRLLEMIFNSWLLFLDDCVKKNHNISLISDWIDFKQAKESYELLLNQKKLFYNDKLLYLRSLMKCGKSNALLHIKSPIKGTFIHHDLIASFWHENLSIFDKMANIHAKCNAKNNKISKYFLHNVFCRIRKGKIDKYLFGEIINRKHHINKGEELRDLYPKDTRYVNMVSANRQFDMISKLLTDSRDDIPLFIFSHIEEPHNICTFFSYDTFQKDNLNEELIYAQEYVDSLKDSYKGLIAYDLSVRYVDLQFKKMYEQIKQSGQLNNTVFVICADHGSSYSCTPPRNRNVINFHSENYHIPLLIIDESIKKHQDIDYLMSNKDVISTLLDYLGFKNNFEISNNSALSTNQKVITIEFMGSGCPDVRRRPVWIQGRTNKMIVNFSQSLSKPFCSKNVESIFDLEKDPHEERILLKTKSQDFFDIIEVIKERFETIREKYGK